MRYQSLAIRSGPRWPPLSSSACGCRLHALTNEWCPGKLNFGPFPIGTTPRRYEIRVLREILTLENISPHFFMNLRKFRKNRVFGDWGEYRRFFPSGFSHEPFTFRPWLWGLKLLSFYPLSGWGWFGGVWRWSKISVFDHARPIILVNLKHGLGRPAGWTRPGLLGQACT